MTTRRELMTGGALALAASPLAVAQALAEHEPMVELYRQSDQLMAAPAIQAAFGTVYL